MYDICIKDRLVQCFHDCERCPQCNKSEPDYDFLRDIENERDYEQRGEEVS